MGQIGLTLGLASLAGAAALLGAGIVMIPRIQFNPLVLSCVLSLSAGVMLYISFVELMSESSKLYQSSGYSSALTNTYTGVFFFLGFVCVFLLDIIAHFLEKKHQEKLSSGSESDIAIKNSFDIGNYIRRYIVSLKKRYHRALADSLELNPELSFGNSRSRPHSDTADYNLPNKGNSSLKGHSNRIIPQGGQCVAICGEGAVPNGARMAASPPPNKLSRTSQIYPMATTPLGDPFSTNNDDAHVVSCQAIDQRSPMDLSSISGLINRESKANDMNMTTDSSNPVIIAVNDREGSTAQFGFFVNHPSALTHCSTDAKKSHGFSDAKYSSQGAIFTLEENANSVRGTNVRELYHYRSQISPTGHFYRANWSKNIPQAARVQQHSTQIDSSSPYSSKCRQCGFINDAFLTSYPSESSQYELHANRPRENFDDKWLVEHEGKPDISFSNVLSQGSFSKHAASPTCTNTNTSSSSFVEENNAEEMENPSEIRSQMPIAPVSIMNEAEIGSHDDHGPQVVSLEIRERQEGIEEKPTPIVQSGRSLQGTGYLVAFALTLHGIPEGVTVAAGVAAGGGLGLTLAVAIAIHKIPEGLAVAAPIYFATKSRIRAFLFALVAAASEPLGAALALLVFNGEPSPTLLAGTFAFVAGMMVRISLWELLPAAQRIDKHNFLVGKSLFLGMLIMAVSLALIEL